MFEVTMQNSKQTNQNLSAVSITKTGFNRDKGDTGDKKSKEFYTGSISIL